jgi:hypothetical protein
MLAVLLLLCTTYSNNAAAQFWKRAKKEQKRKPYNKPVKKPEPVAAKAEKPKKKRVVDYPKTEKKTRYRIDVLMPLYLDELVKNNQLAFKGKMPEKAQSGVSFYEGVRLAADTMRDLQYKTDVYIHDIANPASTLEKLLAKDSLRNSDLIIGLVLSQQVTALAEYAKKNQVNFVSALSPSDANIKDNPFFILMNPTLQTNCDFVSGYLNKKYPKKNIVLYKSQRSNVDSLSYSYFKEQLKESSTVVADSLPALKDLEALFDSSADNIVVMPLMENAYAESLLQQLKTHFPDYHFDVYGMPGWKSFLVNRKSGAFGENIGISVTSPYYFDATVSYGQLLTNTYKQRFNAKPGELVYRGFETLYWFTDLLYKYGTIFNEHVRDNSAAMFTQYDLQPKWDNDNNFYYTENRHLYFFHYLDGNVLIEQ